MKCDFCRDNVDSILHLILKEYYEEDVLAVAQVCQSCFDDGDFRILKITEREARPLQIDPEGIRG